MKLFLSAVLLMFFIKGLFYILMPKVIQTMAFKIMECPSAQLVAFGWILVVATVIAWLSVVRYLPV